MIDHYNDLGFLLRTDVDLKKLIERAFDEGQRIDSDGGYYLRWRPGSDIELWVQVDRENNIMGCLPHFSGHGRMTLEIEELAWVDTLNTALEGILSCNSCPEADGFEEDISVPVLADSPDFGILRHSLRCPVKVRAQVTAFAHEIRCFEDEYEHQEAQQQELPPPPIGPESSDLKEKARRRIDRMTRAPESYFPIGQDRKSTRLNSSHSQISYAVFCLKKKQLPRSTAIARATDGCSAAWCGAGRGSNRRCWVRFAGRAILSQRRRSGFARCSSRTDSAA